MHDSVITGKEYASKDWTCVISMFLTSFNVHCILCVVVHVLCVYASKLLSGFFGTSSGFFWWRQVGKPVVKFSKIRSCKGDVSQPVQPHTYARLLVFDETLAQPHFEVVNCSDAVMSVFYSPFSTRSQNFAVMNTCVAALSVFPSDILSWSADILCFIKNRGGTCKRICILCQQISPKCWFGNKRQTVTSQSHHTRNKWPPYATEWYSPYENFLRTPLPPHIREQG